MSPLRALAVLVLASSCVSAPLKKAEEAPLFAFHEGFWLNLHQLLLAEGRPHRRPVPGPAHDGARWVESIGFYRGDYSQRFFLDDDLAKVNLQLASEDASALSPSVGPGLRTALERVAPEFRGSEWPEDLRRSQEWVAQVQPLLARFGRPLAAEVARVFRTPWPGEPLRVELSKQAGPFGAYTVGPPALITMSTADPGYQGAASLEMLFHEASHTLDVPLTQALEKECAKRGVPVPEHLDHALLFYSVGELARRQLAGLPALRLPQRPLRALTLLGRVRSRHAARVAALPRRQGRHGSRDGEAHRSARADRAVTVGVSEKAPLAQLKRGATAGRRPRRSR
ncbi:MAG: hypothetical protein ACYC8T_07410 [Myxococcaceae bacterium]